MIDCQKCAHSKWTQHEAYWWRDYYTGRSHYIHPEYTLECMKLYKKIRVYKRNCKKFTPKTQSKMDAFF